MAKKTNSTSDLLAALSTNNTGSFSRLASLGSASGTRTAGTGNPAQPIDFGHGPKLKTPHPQSNEMGAFLSSVARGGLLQALGAGGGGLSIVGNVESLVSGIAKLFGGGKNVHSFSAFAMPGSKETTIQVANAPVQGAPGGLYGNSDWIQNNSTAIAQAVKSALLQSSSLSDVISEI